MSRQSLIFSHFKRRSVATMAQLCSISGLTRMAIFSALKHHGYHTSFNHNARYYVLGETPRFDSNGLWFHRTIGFSQHDNLPNTLVALVNNSRAGYTPSELNSLLRTSVNNLLPRLFNQQRLGHRMLGRNVVYFACESQLQEQQLAERLKTGSLSHTDLAHSPVLSPLSALPLLSELIRFPEKSLDQLVRSLKSRGVSLCRTQIQTFLDFHQLGQKRGTLRVAEVFQTVLQSSMEQLRLLGTLPKNPVYTFDQLAENAQPGQILPPVIKTRCRRVISLQFGQMVCREVLRQTPHGASTMPSGLENLVPKGLSCAYDVIAHVGIEYFLRSNTLKHIHESLKQRTPSITIPTSTLYDICGHFLHLFGELHKQNTQTLGDLCQKDGKSVWLLDCTTERDSPSFFGVLETHFGILLGSWKVATENETEVVLGLQQAVEWFGKPGKVLHDLSKTLTKACKEVLPDVPDYFCHYHFSRDVGAGLFEEPNHELSKRIRETKIQIRMREQRKEQTGILRKQVTQGQSQLVLERLLAGEKMDFCWSAMFGRELLLALHFWILDYAQEGKRQGYPFDPHPLYLHRRLVKAGEMLDVLLANQEIKELPICLVNLHKHLQAYRNDETIRQAASLYNKAAEIFGELRQTLRLKSVGKTPMSETHALSLPDQSEVKKDLTAFYEKCQKVKGQSGNKVEKLYEVVINHISKYMDKLFYEGTTKLNEDESRTTNQLEQTWRKNKRRHRIRHGRKELKSEMRTLPAEALLVGNLEIPQYVEVVAGSMSQLPQRFAEIGLKEKPCCFWKKQKQVARLGMPPKSFLRRQSFLQDLLEICPMLPKTS